MKALILAITLLSTNALFANDCAENSYGLKKERLAVALDWESGRFHPRTVHAIMGEYFFNDLVDATCVKIAVKDKNVSCINSQGSSMVVGVVREKIGNDEDFVYFSVNWARGVIVKSQSSPLGCAYGMALL